MKNKDIDKFTDEDLAYARSIDFSNGLTADEVPFIKAYQEKKGIRKMYAPRKKTITLRIDEDILAVLKQGGRGYQTRLNSMLREWLKESLAH
ncbi:MAG: BrnA antitoxin family protein [Neisseriaceae bacterium]|nr:BrnA antitoxin family protein [Neisseriaceae bacterium]MBR3425424.1 BrnA antitoxin family protein [Neisseriaceae bacterium]